jgi:acetoacetate decarboxylase
MEFVRSKQELLRLRKGGAFLARFTGAQMLWVVARTDPGVAAGVLPSPLRAPADPVMFAFVAHYPQTNLGISYREGALMIGAELRGEPGWYCVSMPVDDDVAMICGREFQGFPKKMADSISLDRDGATVTGSVVRKGVEILRIEGEYRDPVPSMGLPWPGPRRLDPDGRPAIPANSFLFKYSFAADGGGFAHLPQLVRQVTTFAPRDDQLTGVGKLTLTSGPVDGLGEFPVRDLVATGYGTFDNTMLPGRVVRRVYWPMAFVPYSLFKNDLFTHLAAADLPVLSWQQRRQQRHELAQY